MFPECNPTDWQGNAVASCVVYNGDPVSVTWQLKVERIEILEKLPSVWPVPQLPTTYVHCGPLHAWVWYWRKREGSYGRWTNQGQSMWNLEKCFCLCLSIPLIPQDQDSWSGGTGTRDSTPSVPIFHHLLGSETESVSCRCSRLACQRCFACAKVDSQLLNVTRSELDPASHEAILNMEKSSRN
jgi:hypothetical protein